MNTVDRYPIIRPLRLAAIVLCSIWTCAALACGGGYVPMPYIPSNGSSMNAASSKGSFYLIEKGSANDLFEIKSLQPLFRNIHMSGNERKHRDKLHKNHAAAADSTATIADSTRTDSTHTGVCHRGDSIVPILNLHRIH